MRFNCKSLVGTISNIFIFSFITIATSIVNLNAQAKVAPPNYNFSLNKFDQFKPDTPKATIEKEFKNGEIYESTTRYTIVKYQVKHIRYVFPIFVQYYQDKVIDFWAKLPNYFLHDIFLQSLINRYGKQDKYYNQNAVSLYFWKDSKDLKILYSGTCTITCFPIYLYIRNANTKKLPGLTFLIDKFK